MSTLITNIGIITKSRMKIFVEKEQAQIRYDICKKCVRYEPMTTLCKECSCVTKMKVKFVNTECPLKKW